MSEKACRTCRLIVSGDVCPTCKDSELTKAYEGFILVINPESEVGNAIAAKTPGKYALKIK
jgi:DNA-directed RNA polymerase subunit E"